MATCRVRQKCPHQLAHFVGKKKGVNHDIEDNVRVHNRWLFRCLDRLNPRLNTRYARIEKIGIKCSDGEAKIFPFQQSVQVSNNIVDTLVVHALNDACLVFRVSTLGVPELTR